MNETDDLLSYMAAMREAPASLKQTVGDAMLAQPQEALSKMRPALAEYPKDPDLLLMAAMAAVLAERPDQSLVYQKRFRKHFVSRAGVPFLHAVALAQKQNWPQAARLVKEHQLTNHYTVAGTLPGGFGLLGWITTWLTRIDRENKRAAAHRQKRAISEQAKKARKRIAEPTKARVETIAAAPVVDEVAASLPALPAVAAGIPVAFELPQATDLAPPEIGDEAFQWFRLRSELARLSLLQGFDELLCLPLLHNVDTYWYQVETVRKVLKQFRGRVLLVSPEAHRDCATCGKAYCRACHTAKCPRCARV